MMDATKYAPGYYPAPAGYDSWVKKDHIEKAPAFCSVDLRDGNQALIVPMSLEEKIEFFKMLVKIGFKEIEVGFPAASETEYEFLRVLIEQNMIPEDVTVQVLTQCRDHIIRRTFEAVKGAPRAVIHFYNSTSVAQREQVFHKSKEEIKQIATDGAKLVKQLSEEYEGNFLFEYSPESFTGTEPDYALEVCNAVIDIMQPTPDRPMIINLPVTVEMSMPHVYASQIEYCSANLHNRDSVILSTHPHNDRGTGVACAELAVLAGAQRIECCLFGNGERTGNVDAITLALNMYSHGVDPKLDFSDMPAICELYERVTRMHVYERTPYAGQLVFAAFSGSHQDAIAKGMSYRKATGEHRWTCPYIPIAPTTSAAPTTPTSSASTARAARAASALCWSRTTATTCPPRCGRTWATRSRPCPTTATRSSPPPRSAASLSRSTSTSRSPSTWPTPTSSRRAASPLRSRWR